MLPKKIHYIFGLDEKWCNKPLAEFHFLNLLSARKRNPDYEITIHYHHMPGCKVWKKIFWEFQTRRIDKISDMIGKKRVIYKEHIGDFLRLNLLKEHGGIYLDLDVVCVKSFDELLDHEFVMGTEKSNLQVEGLCNAVMLSEPNSAFVNVWIDDYLTNFQPEHWNFNSVVRPFELSQKYNITVLPHTAFFKYCWDEIDRPKIFEQTNDVREAYCLHLWETKHYELLKKYDMQYVKCHNDTLSNIYKM